MCVHQTVLAELAFRQTLGRTLFCRERIEGMLYFIVGDVAGHEGAVRDPRQDSSGYRLQCR